MKKILKSIPLLALALPLMAGCGKKGPDYSGKGSLTTYEEFQKQLIEAQKNLDWQKSDVTMGSFVTKSEEVTKTKDVCKINNKTIKKGKTELKSKSKGKVDTVNGVTLGKTTETYKSKMSGKAIKKSKTVNKTKAKSGMEVALVDGKYTLSKFNHLEKTYQPTHFATEKEDIMKYFNSYVAKSSAMGIVEFDMHQPVSQEDLANYKFYVKGNVFTVYCEKTVTNDENEFTTKVVKTVEKQQVKLDSKNSYSKYFIHTETVTTYKKADSNYPEGAVTTHIEETKKENSLKQKNVKLSASKVSKYSKLGEVMWY